MYLTTATSNLRDTTPIPIKSLFIPGRMFNSKIGVTDKHDHFTPHSIGMWSPDATIYDVLKVYARSDAMCTGKIYIHVGGYSEVVNIDFRWNASYPAEEHARKITEWIEQWMQNHPNWIDKHILHLNCVWLGNRGGFEVVLEDTSTIPQQRKLTCKK